MENCVIVAYGRSAIGKAGRGSLADVNPIDFGAEVLKGVIKRVPQLKLDEIDDVIVGCAIPEGKMGLNPGRNLVIRAGLPAEVPGQTVNRFCASGVQAVVTGASMIMSGLQDVVVAGGVESMSCPVLSESTEFLNQWLLEKTDIYMPMGITAENVAEKFGITRERMEQMSVESHAKATAAVENGLFDNEIIPVNGFNKDGNSIVFKKDECYRKGTNMESLGIKTFARFLTFSVEGLDPAYMGLGPIYAIEEAIEKTNLSLEDIDVIELNEAFASQAIATMDELSLDKRKVNPRGGALALGHPLGATGAILLGKALNYLQAVNGRYGLVSMCIGGGMGAACIFEIIKE